MRTKVGEGFDETNMVLEGEGVGVDFNLDPVHRPGLLLVGKLTGIV